jgi:hypothetical protein
MKGYITSIWRRDTLYIKWHSFEDEWSLISMCKVCKVEETDQMSTDHSRFSNLDNNLWNEDICIECILFHQ